MSKVLKIADGFDCIVDDLYFDFFHSLKWELIRNRKSWYARTTFKNTNLPRYIYMHRLVAQTPSGMVCHHINRNSLDNRSGNLVNMTKQAHHRLHENNSLTVKYARSTPPEPPAASPPPGQSLKSLTHKNGKDQETCTKTSVKKHSKI